MPILTDLIIQLDVDQVLCGQGIDPAQVRARRPKLLNLTEKAIEVGRPLLEPRAVYERFTVQELRHEQLSLVGGGSLAGSLIASNLGHAEQVVVVVCTVGEAISQKISEIFSDDPALAVSLDGMASSAVEALGNQLCQQFEHMAKADGLTASVPLNPGMVGWPVEEAQPQIFSLLDPFRIGVELTPSGLMKPLKSLSLVLGLGHEIQSSGVSCDYCGLQKTCRYKGSLSSPNGTA